MKFLALTFCSFSLFAQTHLKNQKFIELGLGGFDGLGKENHSLSFSIGQYKKQGQVNMLEFVYAHKKVSLVDAEGTQLEGQAPVALYLFNLKRLFPLWHNYNNTLIFSLGAAANVGFESINKNKKQWQGQELKAASDFILGLSICPAIEWNNWQLGLNMQGNLISRYQKLSTLPTLKYRFHL